MSGLEDRILILIKDLEEEKRLADKRAKQLYITGASFIGHGDTPATYAGQAGKIIKVNATPDALEFVDWLDQALKQASSPTFGGMTINGDVTIAHASSPRINIRDTDYATAQVILAHGGGSLTIGLSGNYAIEFRPDWGVKMACLKRGISQAAAGATAGELWVDSDDGETIKRGT